MSRTITKTIDLTNQIPIGELQKYITRIDDNGIQVHPQNMDKGDYVQIDGNGMDVYSDGARVARFGANVVLGLMNTYLQISSDLMEFTLNNQSMAKFGYDEMFQSYGVQGENVFVKGAGNALRLDNAVNGTYQGQYILETRANGHLSLKPGLKRTEEVING